MDKDDKIIIKCAIITIIVLLLLFFTIDWINSYNVFLKAINDGNLQKVKKLAKSKPFLINKDDKYGFTPLFKSIEKRRTEISVFLIENGADLNCQVSAYSWYALKENFRGDHLYLEDDFKYPIGTPLLSAMYYDQKLIPLLIKKGADVNKTMALFERKPLHYAAKLGNIETVKLLIEAGADLNPKDLQQRTPLCYASESENSEIIELLIKNGADPNIVIPKTPLETAVENNCETNVLTLLEMGAKPNMKDLKGKTPLDYAIKTNNKRIYNIIMKYIDKVNKIKKLDRD